MRIFFPLTVIGGDQFCLCQFPFFFFSETNEANLYIGFVFFSFLFFSLVSFVLVLRTITPTSRRPTSSIVAPLYLSYTCQIISCTLAFNLPSCLKINSQDLISLSNSLPLSISPTSLSYASLSIVLNLTSSFFKINSQASLCIFLSTSPSFETPLNLSTSSF